MSEQKEWQEYELKDYKDGQWWIKDLESYWLNGTSNTNTRRATKVALDFIKLALSHLEIYERAPDNKGNGKLHNWDSIGFCQDCGVKSKDRVDPCQDAWRYRHVSYVDWTYSAKRHPDERLEQEPLYLGEGYDERGNLVRMSDKNGR